MDRHALEVLEYAQVIALLEARATSGLGQRQARQVAPLTDREEIERLIGETTELKELLAPARELPIGGLHDLLPLLEKLEDGEEVLLTEEILLVADTLRAGRQVRAYLEEADKRCPRLRAYAGEIGAYPEIEARIADTFNEGGAIKNTASPALRSIRRNIEQLRGRIRSKLQSLLRASGMGPFLQDTGIREVKGRPTLAIKAQHAARVDGARRDRSDSGGTVFVEPAAVRPMVDELEGMLDAEKAEMRRILAEITAMIVASRVSLRRMVAALAHIDMTYAKVRLSRDFGMHPPHLNGEGIVRLDQAHHPLLVALQQRTGAPAEVVPIDVRLGEEFQVLIITGPNTGGKTVALKTIGLLTLMAQAGMHVPAGPDSTFAVFENVLADIGDEQSIEQSLSTFSSHLRNIAEILALAGERSLVLMDELGGGTDPAEGAALARAILEFLQQRRARTVVSTHISDLKRLGYTVPGIENASIEFDLETLRPTHRLVIGTPGSSNALAIARRLGLPGEVIDRAEQSPRGDATGELIAQLQAARRAAREQQQAAERARGEAESLEREWRRRLAELERREVELRQPRGEAAFEKLQVVRQEIDTLYRRESTRRELLEGLAQLRAALEDQSEESPLVGRRKTLEIGDLVRVRSLDRVGVLSEIDRRGGKAVVRFGEIPLRVALEEVDAAE